MYIRRPAAPRVRDVAFFAAFAVYVWAGIDTRLISHWQGPVFSTVPGFFAAFLRYPGGPADYLQTLLAQTYAWQFWGALVVTAGALAVTALTHAYFQTVAEGRLSGGFDLLRFVPAGLLLYLLNFYYDGTPVALSLMVALTLAILFARLVRRWPEPAALLAASVAMGAASYYLAGMALVIFAPAAAITIFIQRRRHFLWLAPLLVAAGLSIAGAATTREWFLKSDGRSEIAYWCLYGFYVAAAVIVLRRGPARRRVPEFLITASLLLCLICLAAASYRMHSRDRRLTAMDYEALQENWPAVLDVARLLPAADFNSLTRYEVNLALHETHRLGDDMFRFPQKGPMLLDLRADPFLPYMIRVTDLCIRLGRINEAERFGSEAMLLHQGDPRVYRQMVTVNMMKGRAEAARKFLRVLSYDLRFGRWARERLDELDGGTSKYDSRVLKADDVMAVWQRPGDASADANRLLLDQLEQDPTNRTAFEFLMGNYLLARDMPAVHGLMWRYQAAEGERRTPRHYQEAMAIYANATGQPVRMPGLVMEPETEQRFETFKKTVRQYATREAAMQSVWNDFRDSYFFYFTFGPGDYR